MLRDGAVPPSVPPRSGMLCRGCVWLSGGICNSCPAPRPSPVTLLRRGCQGSGPPRISAVVNGHGRGPAVLTDVSDMRAV